MNLGSSCASSADRFWLSATHARVLHLKSPDRPNPRAEEDTATLRDLLLCERNALQAATRSISAEINRLSAISRLPPELLGLVFSQLVKDEIDQCLRCHDPTALKWTSVTRVCHRWRQIAFDHPHLWRHIVFPTSSESLLEEVISRSKRAPLVISWVSKPNGPRPFPWRSAALALKTLDRVELISIIDFDGNVSDLRNLLVTPAPLLEAVDVRIPSESEPIHLPATLFANHAPRLRYISLGNVAPFPWSSPFPTIVSLKLSQPCLTPQSVSELLDTLRNLPMLEELELERCLPVFTQGFAAAADLIAQGNLKKLSLYDDVEKCAGFLQHLRMPWSSVVLHLGCDTDGDATVFRVLYPYIAPVHSPRQITAMEVESSYRGQILFRGHLGEVENICDGPATDAQPNLSLSFGWEDLSAGRTAHMMQELAAVVGVRELRYLHIDLEDSIWSDPPEFPESIWLDTFAACPNLEGIKAEHNSGISLCRVLTAVTLDEKVWRRTDVEDGPLYPTGALIWPELRAISLYRASMNHVYDDGRSLRRVLAQSLRDRDERECPVDALDFLSCQVKPRWHRRFEHIVEEVTCWDDDDEDFEFVDSVEDSEDGGEEAAS